MNKEEVFGKIALHIIIFVLMFFLTGLISYFVYYDLSWYLVEYWAFIKGDLWRFYVEDEGYNGVIQLLMMLSVIGYFFYLLIIRGTK